MKAEVSEQNIEQFQTQGFTIIENFLDAAELEEWRGTVGEAVEERLRERNGMINFGNDSEFYKNVFTQCLRLSDTHEGIRHLVQDARLGKVAADLAGADAMRMWHDQALIKPPYGNQTAWHFDTPYWAFYSHKSVNMWFALDDATLANGCLWYLPGTHRRDDFRLVPINQNMTDLFNEYPEWKRIEAVPAPCSAGSLVVHNGMVAHAASSNMTARPRRAMTSVYFPDGEVYNGQPDTLPEVYYKTLKKGDRLDDDRYLPLVWSRNGGGVYQ